MADSFDRNALQQCPKTEADSVPMSDAQTAFSCIARFSTSLTAQSKVASSIEYFLKAFGLGRISIYRLNAGENRPQQIISVGALARSNAEFDTLFDLAALDYCDAGSCSSTVIANNATLLKIVLRKDVKGADIMQVVIPQSSHAQTAASITAMAPALAVSWQMRQPGLVSALIHAQSRTRRPQQAPDQSSPILGAENAYGFSRSEFRVCCLLANGMTPKTIADSLGLSIATIRTHRRAIYAKTEMSGQVEVVSHIGRFPQPMMQAA